MTQENIIKFAELFLRIEKQFGDYVSIQMQPAYRGCREACGQKYGFYCAELSHNYFDSFDELVKFMEKFLTICSPEILKKQRIKKLKMHLEMAQDQVSRLTKELVEEGEAV